MKDSLQNKCRLFIENRDAFKAAFPWESSYFYPVCASVFTDKQKVADPERLKECRLLLKRTVGIFSNFRGTSELALVAMLAVDDDPKVKLDKAFDAYYCLKEQFFGSEYLTVASVMLADFVEPQEYGEICKRARRIFDLMKKEHPFITSSEDVVFATMLALSEKSDSDAIAECETCYSILKETFYDRNALQSLSHVLTLCDDGLRTAKDKCRDTVRLYDMLKEKKNKYGTGYELATLGVLAMLPCGIVETACDLLDVSEYLKGQKGYGFWGIGRAHRLMHAAMIVASEHLVGSGVMAGAAVSSTISLIAAQHAATCAAISASIAASTAARSGT